MMELILEHDQPDPEQARCADCFYLRGAVSLWCTNEDAIAYRGTRFPGIRGCFPFWKPMRTKADLSRGERFRLRFLGGWPRYCLI